jgi:DNA topoisomerase-1
MRASVSLTALDSAEEAGLVYVTDAAPGIKRTRHRSGFRYQHPSGEIVRDKLTLDRIRSLAIPPAYERVWICAKPNGHLQAIGYDARGRKQYRYHPKFREVRDESKFCHMIEFARQLPSIRERVDADLAKAGMPREKVLAAVVYLLEKSLIRIGNEEYARTNNHYGLTTMLNRHAKVVGANIRFKFKGKSGIEHEIEIHDRRLAKIVSKAQELPGQELFNYVDADGKWHDVTSSDVNAYLKEISNGEFTAKDFRTWSATVMALTELAKREIPASQRGGKQAVTEVMKSVARLLGNTPAVCRKCYVHPAVVSAYLSGALPDLMKKCACKADSDELAVAILLEKASEAMPEKAA